jgi:hypothetical protein|nr:MAG TPA: hypothetical protein [Caudoviricetes sp.]
METIDNMDLIEPDVETEKSLRILTFEDDCAVAILAKEYRRRHPQETFWQQANGKLINIKDMTDQHLLNAIKLINRKRAEHELIDYPDDMLF